MINIQGFVQMILSSKEFHITNLIISTRNKLVPVSFLGNRNALLQIYLHGLNFLFQIPQMLSLPSMVEFRLSQKVVLYSIPNLFSRHLRVRQNFLDILQMIIKQVVLLINLRFEVIDYLNILHQFMEAIGHFLRHSILTSCGTKDVRWERTHLF